MTSLLTAGWKDWYRAQHHVRSSLSGNESERYVASALALYHDDYVNPAPAGSLGDGGCDGIAQGGTVVFACYGTRDRGERHLVDKVEGDLARAEAAWPAMTEWRFVTNAPFGPLATQKLQELQAKHAIDTARPVNLRVWDTERLWTEIVRRLEPDDLDHLFPGAPGRVNVTLSDLIPLLDVLADHHRAAVPRIPLLEITDVPPDKVTYNSLPATAVLELCEGRKKAPSIENWFASRNPKLRDQQAGAFASLYRDVLAVTTTPSEILERLYVALGGDSFRLDSVRANAVYAVTAFFFDACDLFERPPDDWRGVEDSRRAFEAS